MNRNKGAFHLKDRPQDETNPFNLYGSNVCVCTCVCVCMFNPYGCCQLMLKLEHETWAAAHKILTLDHRACKKLVSLGYTWTGLEEQLIPYTRVFNVCLNH